jgi:succinyl-CoA synthetase alpha subunit
MAILVDKNTKVIVCGMTGNEGSFHTEKMIEYGTQIVGGVTPGKGGQTHLGKPIFDTVEEAVAATGANASIVFVPAPFAADSVLECEDAGVPFITLITEGVPVQDMVRVANKIRRWESCPAIFSPPAQSEWLAAPEPSPTKSYTNSQRLV